MFLPDLYGHDDKQVKIGVETKKAHLLITMVSETIIEDYPTMFYCNTVIEGHQGNLDISKSDHQVKIMVSLPNFTELLSSYKAEAYNMKLLITGADRPLGQLAVDHFRASHDLRLTSQAQAPPDNEAKLPYQPADLRTPDEVAPLVKEIDAILHLAVFDPVPLPGPEAEKERLDWAARGTFVLLAEARKAGVERLILASTLAHFDAYPAEYIIDESWQPQPQPQADNLAPYLSEITCREFAREGGIRALCLRFGPLDTPEGTSSAVALQALSGALEMPFAETRYRWQLFHVSSNNRFSCQAAENKLGLPAKGGA